MCKQKWCCSDQKKSEKWVTLAFFYGTELKHRVIINGTKPVTYFFMRFFFVVSKSFYNFHGESYFPYFLKSIITSPFNLIKKRSERNHFSWNLSTAMNCAFPVICAGEYPDIESSNSFNGNCEGNDELNIHIYSFQYVQSTRIQPKMYNVILFR